MTAHPDYVVIRWECDSCGKHSWRAVHKKATNQERQEAIAQSHRLKSPGCSSANNATHVRVEGEER
jgi:hypothetical protein